MFGFIKKIFTQKKKIYATSLSCISMNNEECKARPEIINVNSDDPEFYSFSIKKVNAAEVAII